MIRIEIDLNTRDDDGLTRGFLDNLQVATSSVAIGDEVRVYEPDEGVEAAAIVKGLSPDGHFARLAVDWDSLQEATGFVASIVETYPPPSLIGTLKEWWLGEVVSPNESLEQIALGV